MKSMKVMGNILPVIGVFFIVLYLWDYPFRQFTNDTVKHYITFAGKHTPSFHIQRR